MAKKSFLDAVDVPVPCSQSWDEMTGGEKRRFCASCAKDIHNISAMTRKEARKLLSESKEKLCIRIEKDADGKIKTLKKQLHQITRRVPVAASVLSASLTFSALNYGQDKPVVVGKMAPTASAAHKDEQTRATVSGTITDANGALVPGAAIRLINVKDNSARNALSNAEGFYEFKNVEAAVYRIETEASNFNKFVAENIKIDGDKNLQLTIKLENQLQTICVCDDVPLVTTEPANIGNQIEPRQIENLPLPKGNLFVLGMFPGVAQKPQKKVSIEQQNKTSRISFMIYDPNNEIVPNQQIKLTNQKTKEEFDVTTDQQGIAYFNLIPRGKYDLEISGNGFNTYRQVVQIKEQIEPNVKITLDVGVMVGVVVVDWSEVPLFRAIAQDDNETVKQIINDNFNVNTKDESGKTALHVAVQHENVEIVRFLLEKGAKVNVKDKGKHTPLAMIFDSFGDDDEAITREIIRLLVAKGADINVRNDDDSDATLLMSAAEDDDFEAVKFLLELGANPNLKDEDGETAMQKTDSEEIKQLLKRYGAR